MVRTSQEWKAIFDEKETYTAFAKQVLGDLTHYQSGRNHEDDDIRQLCNIFAALRDFPGKL